MKKYLHTLITIAMTCGCVSHVDAQLLLNGTGPELIPVEQMVEDIGPLNVSIREVQAGLGQPFDFEQLFRVPGRGDLLMRGGGALYAVFPQSEYTQVSERDANYVPVVPANTVFYIGAQAIEDLAQDKPSFGPMLDPMPSTAAARQAALDAEAPQTQILGMRMNWRVDSTSATWQTEEPGERWNTAMTNAAERIRTEPYKVTRLDDQVYATHEVSLADTMIDVEMSLPRIASDAGYRGVRLTQLLERATQANASPNASSQ